MDAFGGLYGEIDLVDGAEDFVDFADCCLWGNVSGMIYIWRGDEGMDLVLEVDGSVEVGNFRIDRFAEHFSLTGV